MRQRTEVRAEIMRPDHQRENPVPKSQVEKADGEEPSGAPRHAHAGVRLDSYLPRTLFGRIRFSAVPYRSSLRFSLHQSWVIDSLLSPDVRLFPRSTPHEYNLPKETVSHRDQ